MAKKISASTGINIRAEIDNIDKIFDTTAEINIYRIVQEAINNIVKHSGATEATIEVQRMPALVSVAIRDNGQGLKAVSPGDRKAEGFGLLGMSERTRILGGTLSVESAPGEGTRLMVSVPGGRTWGEREKGRSGER